MTELGALLWSQINAQLNQQHKARIGTYLYLWFENGFARRLRDQFEDQVRDQLVEQLVDQLVEQLFDQM